MKILPFFAVLLLAAPSAYAADNELTVRKQIVEDRKAVIATVESTREVQARARINGTLGFLAVKEGDRVEAGSKIALIGDPKLAIKGQGSEARIQAAQSAFDKARLDLSRAQELRTSGYGTQARLDDARAAFHIAEQNMQAAKSEKQEIVQQATEGAVLAPGSGRVLKVPVAVGSVVMAGETIATLSQEDYILRMEVPESHARFLKKGDAVEIGARGLDVADQEERKFGTIRLVYPEIKDGRVVADVEASDLGDYFVGERARVYIKAGEREAYIVPSAFIVRRAGVDWVKLKNGQEIAVQTGQRTDETTEVLAGLRDNDVVVMP